MNKKLLVTQHPLYRTLTPAKEHVIAFKKYYANGRTGFTLFSEVSLLHASYIHGDDQIAAFTSRITLHLHVLDRAGRKHLAEQK